MKIVYLYHSLAAFGGLERVLADKMNYLAETLNYEIHFITCDQNGMPFSYPLSPKIRHQNITCICFHSIYKYPYPQRLWAIYRHEKSYKKELLKTLALIQPDILITNTSFNATLLADFPCQCPKIIESHMSQTFTMKAGPKHTNLGILEYAMKTVFDFIFCRKIKKYDILVALTQQDVKDWSKYKKAMLIPNPLTYYPPFVNETDNKQIISVGRLYDQKGFDLLIQAWLKIAHMHPGWKITIYGDGNDKDMLHHMIRSYNLENSIFIHHAVTNIYDKYAESDFLVLSSRAEGFGLVLTEAMSCGKPCVAFNCPSGPDEIITHQVDGLLAENGNIEDLSKKISYMITHEQERKKMGAMARESVKRYTLPIIMQQWDHLFNSLKRQP